MNFTGTLAPDLGNLTQLTILDFMWNNITGPIPPEVGDLRNLVLLLLNGNKLTGPLPPELGKLAKLNRFQIDENNISGPLPASYQFLNARHFHMNNNSLSGIIPKELGNLPSLRHLLLDNNNLSGTLPPELANITSLRILQLDNNQFSGTIPSNYSNMLNLTKLTLRNCNLTGAVPNLTSLIALQYLDLSHNQLSGTLPSGTLSQALTTIDLSFNKLDGDVPIDYYRVPNLQFLILQNNSLDGNILADELKHNPFQSADSVFILDFQNNNFTEFVSGVFVTISNITFRLSGNPVCINSGSSSVPRNACVEFVGSATNVSFPSDTNSSVLPLGCSEDTCDANLNQELVYGLLSHGECRCAYPLLVGYRLKSPGFATFPPYEEGFHTYLSSGLNLSLHQVNVSQYVWETGPRLTMDIKLYPQNISQFTQAEVMHLYDAFMTWSIPDNGTFGPADVLFFIIGYPYNQTMLLTAPESKEKLSTGAIAGIVIGAAVFTAVAVALAMLLITRWWHPPAKTLKQVKRKLEHTKIIDVKEFTYEEMAKATNDFDDSMQIGAGGYGKVYKGVLNDGRVVAIKRAEEGSLQGLKEFYNELQLLSRVHHRNLVHLIGYCDADQMLVYEFMANGTLREHLDAQTKMPLDFPTRLQIALGAAKGILYLHTEANPPIFHRDIKANNILLDGKKRAKVADFGLSKLAPAAEIEGEVGGHVSTVVKGTPGYLDPEYFLTRKLTDKSDVYSFGVVMLELLTGKQPITQGRNLVREVTLAYDTGVILSILDSKMGSYPSESIEALLRLAISCCEDAPEFRPSMAGVVRELESIWRETPLPETMFMVGTSIDNTETSSLSSQPITGVHNRYVSSDIDGTSLISGNILNVKPR